MTVMVFRRSNRNFLRPVHSIKHIVDSQGGLVLNTKGKTQIIHAVDAPVLANVEEVETGAKVYGFFLNVQIVPTTEAALPNIYMIIYKNPGSNIAAGSIPNANVVGSADFKRQVFHQEMLMLSNISATQIPATLFKGVLKIPRTFQNFRVNDEVVIQLFSPGVNIEFCVQCIYKEFR